MKTDFDIVIIGGGMVGAALALSLKHTDYRIAVVEVFAAEDNQQPSFDDRCLAISWGSSRILNGMGLWEQLAKFSTPIERILVCDKGHFGFHRISAEQRKVDFLGQVITSRDCGKTFWAQLKQQQNVTIFCPASIEKLNQKNEKFVEITIGEVRNSEKKSAKKSASKKQRLTTRLLIAADGANSKTRELSGIEQQLSDYGQAAIIANIETQLPHQGLAIERFTENGPLALLPLEDRLSLVWTVPTAEMEQFLELSDEEFIQRLQPVMGQRLGRITRLGRRVGYPLQLLKVPRLFQSRTLLIGNAAHGIHPIAGQGFNLGLRDVAWLAEKLIFAEKGNIDIGSDNFLNGYVSERQLDVKRIIGLTDSLARLFANSNKLLTFSRNIALAAMPFVPPASEWLGETALGLQAPLPRLACGESLEEIHNDSIN